MHQLALFTSNCKRMRFPFNSEPSSFRRARFMSSFDAKSIILQNPHASQPTHPSITVSVSRFANSLLVRVSIRYFTASSTAVVLQILRVTKGEWYHVNNDITHANTKHRKIIQNIIERRIVRGTAKSGRVNAWVTDQLVDRWIHWPHITSSDNLQSVRADNIQMKMERVWRSKFLTISTCCWPDSPFRHHHHAVSKCVSQSIGRSEFSGTWTALRQYINRGHHQTRISLLWSPHRHHREREHPITHATPQQ